MSIQKLLFSAIALLVASLSHSALAGTLNINFTDTTASGPALDGDGAGGGGTWNRVAVADSSGVNSLVKSDGLASLANVTGTAEGVTIGLGNPVQLEAWSRVGMNPDFTVTVSGLLANQSVIVIVYTNRVGSGAGNTDSYIVNGETQSLQQPGEAVVPLPGVEGADYLKYFTTTSATGQISVTGYCIAGLQIQGVLDQSELGPQIDARIAKSSSSRGGKGNNIYSTKKNNKAQTLTQKTTGRKATIFYANFENDGDEFDRFYMMLFYNKKHANLRVRDRSTGDNVTSQGFLRRYRYDLEKDDVRRFQVRVKPKGSRKKISVQVCGSPSTLNPARQDCVTCLTKVKNN